MSAGLPILDVTGLNVWLPLPNAARPLHVVRNVSLRINQGQRFGLVGESGCGKSTTLLSLLGLLPVGASMSGSIRFDGQEMLTPGANGAAALERIRGREITMVMQSSMNALDPVQRIERQIVEAMRPEVRTDKAQARTRCMQIVERVGLPNRASAAYPHELSGGMRQRVSLAIALAAEPKLLLADEPTTALDTIVQARIMELLDELSSDMNLAVLLVSHHLALAAQFCDVMAVMYAGRIMEEGSSEGICEFPSLPYSRLLFAASPDLDSKKEDIRSIPGAPPPLDKVDDGCPFEPRCPSSFERCKHVRPTLQPAQHDGTVACHLVGAHRRADA